jgi:diadenosine tetraphosphate (Ap4A) HIT family hydrolase
MEAPRNLLTCAFCGLAKTRIVLDSSTGFVIRDAFPVSPGHSLIIPKRHVGSLFELEVNEQLELLMLLSDAKSALDVELQPKGYNVGINDGPAAGQTVPHLHIHLIPRFTGDLPDPRGGVRWIFPDKARYWS